MGKKVITLNDKIIVDMKLGDNNIEILYNNGESREVPYIIEEVNKVLEMVYKQREFLSKIQRRKHNIATKLPALLIPFSLVIAPLGLLLFGITGAICGLAILAGSTVATIIISNQAVDDILGTLKIDSIAMERKLFEYEQLKKRENSEKESSIRPKNNSNATTYIIAELKKVKRELVNTSIISKDPKNGQVIPFGDGGKQPKH